MGVIHKLTEEVIQFILEKKKEDPKIGCRSLSEIVSERFSRKVSKSSINSVLKEHGLSGSIGRPASPAGVKKDPFRIPQEKKERIFGPEHAGSSKEPESVKEANTYNAKLSDDRPQLRADPVQNATIQAAETSDVPQKQNSQEQTLPENTFWDEVEIIKEKERQEAGADLLSAGVVFVHAGAHYLGLVPALSNLFRQHLSVELPSSLERVISAVLALHFLGVKDEDEIGSSKTEIVWALNGKEILDSVRGFWNKFMTAGLPERFDLIFKNEIAQQLVHGSSIRLSTEIGPPIILDAQLSCLGRRNGAIAIPITKALDNLSERIVANNKPVIIESIEKSNDGHELCKNLLAAFDRCETRFKAIDVIGEDGEVIASFSHIPRKRREFIVGTAAGEELFNKAVPSLKWGSFSPIYVQRLGRIYYIAQFDSGALANDLGSTQKLAKTVVISSDREIGPQRALISNLINQSADSIAEQYLSHWPIYEHYEQSFAAINTNEIDNTLEMSHVTSIHEAFSLLSKIIFKYITPLIFKGIGNFSDVTSLDRILYTINGKVIKKEAYIKTCINTYQPDKLNTLLKTASRTITRLHITDFNKRHIVVIVNK
jgi:hypothetical protein